MSDAPSSEPSRRERMRKLARRYAENRERERIENPRPEHEEPRPIGEELSETFVKRPNLGLAFLVLGPLLLPLALLYKLAEKLGLVRDRGARELKHESLLFKFHDTLARYPTLALLLVMLGPFLFLFVVAVVVAVAGWLG